MRVIVAGSRTIKDFEQVKTAIEESGFVTHPATSKIVSGGASGVDQLGERYARETGCALDRFPAQWERYGRSAGFKRNEEMAQNADALVAVWDGRSRGTRHMIDVARAKGLAIFIRTVTIVTPKRSAK